MENQKEIQTAEQLLVDIINERTRRHVIDALAAAEAIGDGFEGHEVMNKAIRESYPLTNIL